MKTIIIATDFSKNAWRAAGYAAKIYRKIPCRFILFHVYYEGESLVKEDVPHIIASKSEEINKDLTKTKNEFQELVHHIDTTVEGRALYGEIAKTIVNEAKNQFADLIIIGTKGTGNKQTTVVGSSTLAILDDLPCSVICVPIDTRLTGLNHIMFATDYHNIDNLSRLVQLKEIAEANGSRISIVNIMKNLKVPVPIENGMDGLVLHNFLGVIPNEFYNHQADDIEAGILNFANQKEVNMIVMINREKTFWEGLFHKSISKDTALNSTLPLLILKD
jgi:nucleotide-binding universal stress UspA family protein